MTVWTSDILKAGTDANVFLQMYGTEGKTDEIVLNNRSDNFERGMKEKFKASTCIYWYYRTFQLKTFNRE